MEAVGKSSAGALGGTMETVYSGSEGQMSWTGIRVPMSVITEVRTGHLQERLNDEGEQQALVAELQALATTDMQSQTIELLLTTEPKPLDWQVGEAIAEVFLEKNHGAVWPWNGARDRKTPKASLPGADLVGFTSDADGAVFLFGEVKTSNDAGRPPGVVYGAKGLSRQIENLSQDQGLHWALLKWLRARCTDEPHRTLWQQATSRFVATNGADFRLVGCLMRDLEPDEGDLLTRGRALGTTVTAPAAGQLIAWYLPEATCEWPAWAERIVQ